MRHKLLFAFVVALLLAAVIFPTVASADGGQLTVNTGTISGCSIGVVQNGSWVVSPATFSGTTASFNLPDNDRDYELRINKGGMSITLTGRPGDTIDVPVKALGMDTGVISGCTVSVVQGGSYVYSPATITGSTASWDVFDNDQNYEVRISKGGMGIYLYGKAGSTVTAPVKTLSADTGVISGCTVSVVQGGSYVYSPVTVAGSTVSYDVFDNGQNYEVRISKGGMGIYLYGKAGDTVTAPVKTLSVSTGPISGCTVSVVQGGSYVYSPSVMAGNTASFDVFDNGKDYEVRLSKGGMSIYLYGQADNTLTAPTYAIQIPAGLTNVSLVQGGSYVYQNIPSPGQVYVFQNGQNAEFRYSVNGVNRTDVLKLDGTNAASLTVDFTGLSGVNVYLYDAAGKQVGYVGGSNTASFSGMPAGNYTVKLSKSGLVKTYAFDIRFSDFAAGKTFTVPLINLTVVQPGGVNYACNINVIPAAGAGNIAYSQSGAETVTGMKLFPNESYRIYFSNGMNFTDTFTVGDTDYTYTVPTAAVTFDTTGITYGYGMNLYVYNTSNNATAQYRQTRKDGLYPTALIIGNTYRAVLTNGTTVFYDKTFSVTGDKTIHLFSALFVDTVIPGCTVGVVQNGSWVYSPKVVSGTTAYFPVSDNGRNYEVRISKGGMSINLYGPAYSDIVAPVKTLTVNTGSFTGCTVGVVQNGSWVYPQATVAGSEVSYDVFDNNKDYEVRISKGGMSIKLYGRAGSTLTLPEAQLTVNTGSFTGCTVGVVQNGSWVYSQAVVSGSEISYPVFDNGKSYEVRVSKGGMSISLTGMAGSTVTVPVKQLAVNTGLSGCTAGVVQNGSWVYPQAVVSGSVELYDVFDNGKAYEVRVSKGGMSISLTGYADSGVIVPVKQLTVNTGLSGCTVGIVQNGSWVYSQAVVSGSVKSYDVFDNGKAYEVRVSKGGMSISLTGYADSSADVPIKDLSVSTGGITGCTVGVVQNGSWVYPQAVVSDGETSYPVFDNGKDYEVRMAKGGMSIYVYGKAGTTAAAATYALQIPAGLTKVGLVQNGSWVYQNVSSPGSVLVFQNNKAAELRYTKDGVTKALSFTLNGNAAALDGAV